MRHSILPKASLFFISVMAVISLHALPGLAQSAPHIERTGRPQAVEANPPAQLVQPMRRNPHSPVGFPVGGQNLNSHSCPEGTVLILWDMPIYDDEGLFVIGYEPTPYCVDDDLEPEG